MFLCVKMTKNQKESHRKGHQNNYQAVKVSPGGLLGARGPLHPPTLVPLHLPILCLPALAPCCPCAHTPPILVPSFPPALVTPLPLHLPVLPPLHSLALVPSCSCTLLLLCPPALAPSHPKGCKGRYKGCKGIRVQWVQGHIGAKALGVWWCKGCKGTRGTRGIRVQEVWAYKSARGVRASARAV